MTIDDMINVLNRAKEKLGGDEELSIHLEYQGKGDFVDIEGLCQNFLGGLHLEVSAPWWAYK